MSITRNEFKEMIRESVSAEFAGFSARESDYDHAFSPRFERRMERLIRAERTPAWHLVNTAPKRALLVLVVIVLLTATACSIPAVREPLFKFIIKTFDSFSEIVFPEEESDYTGFEHIYEIKCQSEKLRKVFFRKEVTLVVTEYYDSEGKIILLKQKPASEFIVKVDNQKGADTVIRFEDKDIYIYKSEESVKAIWEDGNSVLSINCYFLLTEEEIISIIKMIR